MAALNIKSMNFGSNFLTGAGEDDQVIKFEFFKYSIIQTSKKISQFSLFKIYNFLTLSQNKLVVFELAEKLTLFCVALYYLDE